MRVPHPIFAVVLCGNREYPGGGEECEEGALSTVYMPIEGVLRKERVLLAHSCEDRYSL
jgi:hypothetical protein